MMATRDGTPAATPVRCFTVLVTVSHVKCLEAWQNLLPAPIVSLSKGGVENVYIIPVSWLRPYAVTLS